MLNEILVGGIFLVLAILVQVIGTNFADKRNHKRNLERIKEEHGYRVRYMQKEIFFKKKLEYFEKIAEAIEDNIYFCGIAKKIIQDKGSVEEARKTFENCKLLTMQASPLYSDTLKPTAIGIVKSLMAQGDFERIIKKIKGSKRKSYLELEECYNKLMNAGKETTEKMRKELLSD